VSEEKPLDPTPARIAKARREGNVPRSPELLAAVAFGAASLAVCAVAAEMASFASEAFAAAAHDKSAAPPSIMLLLFALVPAACGALCAAAASIGQTGGFSVTAIGVKLERLNPAEGLRRMLSRETFAHGLRAIAAFIVALCVLTPSISAIVLGAANAGGVTVVASSAWSGVRRVLFVACAVGLIFACAEYAVLRSSWLRRLRMSFEELKREIKEHEGDPHVRGRRKELRRDLLRGSLQSVTKAAFVVANPTHVAIALEYAPPEVPVPTVLVRAADSVALRVREIAARCNIPVVENALLARALFRDTGAGRPIPVEHYVAVAEIVVALARTGSLHA
jgi:flagellar biosynthetic protein FlhB